MWAIFERIREDNEPLIVTYPYLNRYRSVSKCIGDCARPRPYDSYDASTARYAEIEHIPHPALGKVERSQRDGSTTDGSSVEVAEARRCRAPWQRPAIRSLP